MVVLPNNARKLFGRTFLAKSGFNGPTNSRNSVMTFGPPIFKSMVDTGYGEDDDINNRRNNRRG